MEKHTKSPFDGKPRTRVQREKDGRIERITVIAYVVGPRVAKIGNRLAIAGAAATQIWLLYLLAQHPNPTWRMFGNSIALSVLTWPALHYWWRWIFRRRVLCVFTPERISHLTLLGWKHFDRDLPHRFALLHHDRAEREHDWLKFIERKFLGKWWMWKLRRYYGRSYHLVLEYFDQRNDIACIYDRKKAARVLARLRACDEFVAGQEQGSAGIALNPEDEWSRQPGALREGI